MTTKKQATRSLSNHFLIGQESKNLGSDAVSGKLPLLRSVMQYLFHRKNIPKFKFKPISPIICCALKTGSAEAKCEDSQDCSGEEQSVVNRVKDEVLKMPRKENKGGGY